MNLMSIDAQKFTDIANRLNMLWAAPLKIIVCLPLIWQILGPSALTGLAAMALVIGTNAALGNKLKKLQVQLYLYVVVVVVVVIFAIYYYWFIFVYYYELLL